MAEPVYERVGAFLRGHGLTGARMIAAVSGGPDSVCLLHVLSGLKEEFSLVLHVAHLDHGLRDDSAADAAYVAQLAGELGLPVSAERADVQGYRREKGLGLEEAAREVRYRFLLRLASELETPYILTGHTTDDQIETVLLHIIRGAGLRGLIGLKPLTPWTSGGQKFTLVHPLLGTGRRETEGYCRSVGLNPRQDITNFSLKPLRNRLRLDLVPRLREYNPGIEEALLRLAAAAEIDFEYLEAEAEAAWDKVGREVGGVIALDKAALRGLPAALQRYLLRYALRRLLGSLKDIEMRHLDYIMSSLDLAAGRRINLPHEMILAVDYGCYWLGRADALPSPYPDFTGEFALKIPGVTDLPGWQVEARLVRERMLREESELVAYFDREAAGRELAVRTWQPGDRFVPLGLAKEEKIGRFMIAEKIPRRWRRSIPLVVSPRQVIWLVGCRIDDRVKVTADTGDILRLEFKRT